MNEVGYSAATVGPTDFLLGAGVIKDLSSQANFRILCAGSYYEGEQKREFLSPYTTITIDGSRIGFLALTNPDLYNQVAEGNFADVYFADMLKTARQKVDELLPKVEMVVVYGNFGQDMAKRLAEEIPELSLIIDGAPTSAAGGYMHNGIPVVTTRNGLAAVGVVEVTVSHGKVQSYHFEMYDSQRLESYAPDERVQAKLESLGAQLGDGQPEPSFKQQLPARRLFGDGGHACKQPGQRGV